MSNLTPAEKAERRAAAKAEHRALIEWEQNGQQGDRPETPNYDAIVADSASGKTKAKSAKAKGERTPRVNPIDDEVRTVMTDGTHSHPVTVGEIAKSIDRPSSSTQHAVWRMLASGELVKTEGRPARHWHRDMGDMPELPAKEAPTRERKVYLAQSKSGVVHGTHKVKGDDGYTLVTLCTSEGGTSPKVEQLAKDSDAEITCKRCLKASA